LWQHIKDLRDDGKTVLLTTNVLEEAEALCDQVVIMRDGRLTTSQPASPEYLRAHYGPMVITIRAQASAEIRSRALDALSEISEIIQVRATTPDEGAGEFVVTATASAEKEIDGRMVMTLGRSGVVILAVDKRLPSLEEVFTELTTGPRKAAPCQ
jgi:ABC-2 type transport system ATP-binding protein